ncbi:MAG: MFS transporter, partial [Clostridia bacterium]|nr:MFS transporter [Clostridia bacterium]
FLGQKVDAIAGMILMAISYNLYYSFAYPLYNTANSTLIAVSTRNANQRGLLASAANMAVTAGVGLGGMVFPILLGFMIPEGTTGADARTVWFVVFLIIGLITFLVTVLQYFFTRERVTEETLYVPQETKETMSMGKQFNALKGDFNWWIILGFVFLFNFGGAMKNLSLTYYSDLMNTDFIVNLFVVNKSAASGMMMSIFTALGSIPMAAAVAIVWPISLKLGKRGVVLAGLAIGILGDVIAQLGGANPIVVGVGIFLKQLGCAPACYMILAMVSDTLDHNEARNGFRCDGFTMSLYSAIKVAEVPLAQAAFNLITSSGTNKAMFGFSYIWVEGICYALCIVLFLFYNVEKNLKADQEKIKENQKAAVLAAGGEWIEPEERLRRMQEEADRQAEESRIEELKAYCAKKGLNFEEEEAKYQAKKAAKKKK